MIKVIKRKASDSMPNHVPKRRRLSAVSVKTTVNEWIAERRRNQIDSDASSRETIAAWTATDI